MGVVFNFKDSASVDAWRQKAEEYSTNAYEAIKDTAAIVADIKAESRGSMADEMVDLSSAVLTQAKGVTEGIEVLSSAVNSIVSYLSSLVDEVGGAIKSVTAALS